MVKTDVPERVGCCFHEILLASLTSEKSMLGLDEDWGPSEAYFAGLFLLLVSRGETNIFLGPCHYPL